jgi:DNA-directed RNA polymerase subunit M/transcription elongation factor TFIIS
MLEPFEIDVPLQHNDLDSKRPADTQHEYSDVKEPKLKEPKVKEPTRESSKTKNTKRKRDEGVETTTRRKRTKTLADSGDETPKSRKRKNVSLAAGSSSGVGIARSRPSTSSKRVKQQYDNVTQAENQQYQLWKRLMDDNNRDSSDIVWTDFSDQYTFHARVVLLNNIDEWLKQLNENPVDLPKQLNENPVDLPNLRANVENPLDLPNLRANFEKQSDHNPQSISNPSIGNISAETEIVKAEDPVAHILKHTVGPKYWIEAGQKRCKCGSTLVNSLDHQGRSGDEGGDYHYKCAKCQHKWKERA